MGVPYRAVAYAWPTDEDPLAWIAEAACAGAPNHVFFPERGSSYATGKAMCARCPVIEECRAEIDRVEARLAGFDVQGLYAGETPGQRRRRRRDARVDSQIAP